METFLEPTQESGRAFFMRDIEGSIVMLNLLKFRHTADYSATPELAPKETISGEAAYRLYMKHTLPYLKASGGKVLFFGYGGQFLIGPAASVGMRQYLCNNKAPRRSWLSHPIGITYLE